jgi:hypothetical protein
MTTRKRPALPGRPLRNYTDAAKSNGHRRQDGYAAPTAEDRADTAVLAAAAQRGFRLAVQCLRCGQWVVAHESVAAHMGPVCRAKVATG